MNKIVSYFAVMILMTSCLQEIPISFEESENQLVVESYISDLEEIYTVKLSDIANFDGTTNDNSFISGANVVITEIGRSSYTLFETSSGQYTLLGADFFGEVGKSYQLTITLSNGEVYQSSIETIPQKIDILSGEAIYNEREILNEKNVSSIIQEHIIELEIENINTNHFFKLENYGWGETEITYDDCFLGPPPAGSNKCWAYRDPIVRSQLILQNNLGLSNENYKVNSIAVPFDYKGEYIVTIRANAMSSRSYDFWNSVNDQLTRSGGIFDSPFAPIAGNITHVNGNKKALGYFHAFASTTIDICFDRSNIPGTISLAGPYPCSVLCTDIYSPATFEDVSESFCN